MKQADRDRLPPAPTTAAENYRHGRYPMPTANQARLQLRVAEADRWLGLITQDELHQVRKKAAEVIGRERDQP